MNLVSPKNVARLIVGMAAASVLAACGSIHPGQAAVVGTTQISMTKADQRASAYCAVSLASAQEPGAQVLSNAQLRRQALADMITLTVATKVAKEKGVRADPTLYAMDDARKKQLRKVFAKSHPDQVVNAIYMAQKAYALTLALGEDATGMTFSQKNGQQLQAAGEDIIKAAMKKTDITVDGRFGLDDMTAQISQTGSLSVGEAAVAKLTAQALPATQRCA